MLDRCRRQAARHPRRPRALGHDFLRCPYCHGWEVRDQPIGVLGSGPGAVQHAHLLRQWSDDVIFFAHTCPVTASERAALDCEGCRSSTVVSRGSRSSTIA